MSVWPHGAETDDGRAFTPLLPQAIPFCPEISAQMTCWQITKIVNERLIAAGLPMAALEFRKQVPYADNDNGMLFTLALHFIRVVEEVDDDH